jgi:hypothetical protein
VVRPLAQQQQLATDVAPASQRRRHNLIDLVLVVRQPGIRDSAQLKVFHQFHQLLLSLGRQSMERRPDALAEAAVAAIISITIRVVSPSSCPWPSLSPALLSP